MTATTSACPATCSHRRHIAGIEGRLTLYAEWATLTKQSAKLKNLRQSESRRLARLQLKACPFADDVDHVETDPDLAPKAAHAD